MNNLTHGYRVAGLTIASDLELHAASTPWQLRTGAPDITIAAAAVPKTLAKAQSTGSDWEADGETFLLTVPLVARFLIVGGRSIFYEQDPGHHGGDLPLFLLGSCMAVLLSQRRLLVFHASAVTVNGRAMLFCGVSGAGKSTMAAQLSRRGYKLLCDDLCSLAEHRGRGMVVAADGRRLKLWQPAITHLALETQRGPAVQTAVEKFYMHPTPGEDKLQPVGAVYILDGIPENECPSIQPMNLVQTMEALRDNIYRPGLVHALRMEAAYFAGCISLLRQAAVYRLRRPLSFSRMEQVVALLESHWQTLPNQAYAVNPEGVSYADATLNL